MRVHRNSCWHAQSAREEGALQSAAALLTHGCIVLRAQHAAFKAPKTGQYFGPPTAAPDPEHRHVGDVNLQFCGRIEATSELDAWTSAACLTDQPIVGSEQGARAPICLPEQGSAEPCWLATPASGTLAASKTTPSASSIGALHEVRINHSNTNTSRSWEIDSLTMALHTQLKQLFTAGLLLTGALANPLTRRTDDDEDDDTPLPLVIWHGSSILNTPPEASLI